MINAASAQIAELIEELSLAARIESGRYDPTPREADTLELAQAAAARLGEDRVRVTGSGAALETDTDAVERGLAALFQSALRHGGLDSVEVEVAGAEIRLSRVTPASAPVVLGDDLRDLGAAVAVRLVRRLGGSVAVAGETLETRLAWSSGERDRRQPVELRHRGRKAAADPEVGAALGARPDVCLDRPVGRLDSGRRAAPVADEVPVENDQVEALLQLARALRDHIPRRGLDESGPRSRAVDVDLARLAGGFGRDCRVDEVLE
jgi:hypothetical protein